VAAIGAGVVLSLAAFVLAGWLVDRRKRANFVAGLSAEQRARLEGFEKRIGWRGFRELLEAEREQALILRPRLHNFADKHTSE